MAVSNVTSAVIRLGDGVTVAFAFDLEAIDAASIKVGYIEGITVVNADPLTYSVAMNAGLTGGTVTFLVPPVVGRKIYIFRQTDKTQVVSVSRQQSYNPAVVERVWDKLTLISQELKRDVDRAVKTGPDANPDQLITDIETARLEAVASATAATGSAQLASDWAQKAENVPVVAGQFSALHHAAKALASATAAAASAASVDFNSFGYGIVGNAPLLANLDTPGLAAGIYRYDATTLGTFPSGVVAADTGIVILDRMDADDERMTLFHATSEIVHSRRRVAGALQSWVVRGSGLATQAEAEAGTDNTKLMTPLRTEQHMLAHALGWGQTWQSVIASRAASTSYQNTTGRPIMVILRGISTATTGRTVEVSPDNATWVASGFIQGSGVGAIATSNFVVPNGWYYRITGGATMSEWSELR